MAFDISLIPQTGFDIDFSTAPAPTTQTLTIDGDGYTRAGWDAEGYDYTRLQSDDGITTRLYSPTLNDVAWFTLTDTVGLGSASIDALTVYFKVAVLAAYDAEIQIGVRTGGTDYFSASKVHSNTSYELFSETWNLNPGTGLAWTAAELDAVQIAIKKSDADGTRVTFGYAEVEYTAVGGTDHTLTADSGAFTLTGTNANLERILRVVASSVALALTGTSANLEYNRRMTADSGVFAITGTSANLETSREVFAEAGTVTITGTNASLEVSRRLVASNGSVTLTGTDATLRKSIPLTASAGTVSITGTNANLEYSRRLVADSGVYVIAGTNANLETSREVLGESGSFTISGTDATLRITKVLSATSGSVSITGQAVNLEISRRLLAETDMFVITGTDADLIHDESNDYFLTADTGSVTITGTNARATLDLDDFPVSGKNYYIDSNGSVYWVINQQLGLVERV